MRVFFLKDVSDTSDELVMTSAASLETASTSRVGDARVSSREHGPKRKLSDSLARILLLVIVAGAVAVSTVWALKVPIFQDPDESTHTDYAFAIYTSGRILLAREGLVSTDVHEYTRYLQAKTGFRGMRFSSFGRVPDGYGSADFYKKLDAGAPQPTYGKRRPLLLPWVARLYPFGFYALEALVMFGTTLVHPNSLVTMFFAARFFCVALLVPTLLCFYAIFRAMGVNRSISLTVTAGIGFFPLTLSIFSYVQPDNLVTALVAGTLLATLRFRDNPTTRGALAIGVLLAALVLTKTHDAATLTAVVSAMSLAFRRARACLAYVLAPPALAAATLFYVFWVPAGSPVTPFDMELPLHHSLHLGAYATAVHIANTFGSYVYGSFLGGLGFVQFWDAIGWIPHPITYFSRPFTDALLGFLIVATIIIFQIIAVRQLRNIKRLTAVMARRGVTGVLRLAASDVCLNALVLYVAFMLIANIYLGPRVSGRYWLPFVVCTLLCVFRYVPHVVNLRFERKIATLFAGFFLLFDVLAAQPALSTVQTIYYRTRPNVPYHERLASFDESTIEAFTKGAIHRGDVIAIRGWGLDGAHERPATHVALLIDGTHRVAIFYGLPRPDVAIGLTDASFLNCGFTGTIKTRALAFGVHTMELEIGERGFARSVIAEQRTQFVVSK